MSQSKPGGPTSDGKPKKPDITEYLSSSRRKRKSYVLLAFSSAVSADLNAGIAALLASASKNLSFINATSPEDIARNLKRLVVLLIYDDEFMPLDTGLNMIRTMKEHEGAMTPVLFFTRRPRELVTAYNKLLLPFHEVDDYLEYTHMSIPHVINRVRSALVVKQQRRSRRYQVDLPVEYFDEKTSFPAEIEPFDLHGIVLRYDPSSDREVEIPRAPLELPVKGYRGRLIDLSIHGALLQSVDGRVFRTGEQLKIKINLGTHTTKETAEFLRLSAKVQRVLISGDVAACSFECVSSNQTTMLVKFITEIVNEQKIKLPPQIRPKVLVAK